MSAPQIYCDDPDSCTYSDCPTAFCDKGKHSLAAMPGSDAASDLAEIYAEIKASTRQPIFYFLKSDIGEAKFTKLIIALNKWLPEWKKHQNGKAATMPGDNRTIRNIEFTEPKPMPDKYKFKPLDEVA